MRRRKSQRTAEDAAQQESAPGAASDEDADLCTPPPRSTQPIRRAGFLSKKGGGTRRRNWKKRWFVLDGAQLVYYAPDDRKVSLRARGNDDFDQILLSYGFGARGSNDAGNELFGKEPKGVIPLVGASVKVLPQDAHRTREWCFVLSSGGMSYDGDRDDEDDDCGDGDGDGDDEANEDCDNQMTKAKRAADDLNQPDRVFMIEAPTELLRKAWMDSINSALLLLQPRPNPLQQLACKLGFRTTNRMTR